MLKQIYLFGFILFFNSCFVNQKLLNRYKKVDNYLYSGNYEEASKYLDKEISSYSENDLLLYYLDKGMLDFYAGKYNSAINHFDKADHLIENLYTKSISQAFSSMLTNDYAMSYSGEDYENLYISIFKALSYIQLNNMEAALVEIRRFHDKITLLKTRYAEEIEKINNENKTELKAGEYNINDNALARYLSYILYRSDGLYDDARIDLETMSALWDSTQYVYDFSSPEFSHFSYEEKKDSGIVNLVLFSGLAPVKEAWELEVLTFLDHIIITGKPSFNRTFAMKLDEKNVDLSFKFSIPTMSVRDSRVDMIRLFIDGKEYSVYKLESIDKMAINTFKLDEETRLIKHVSRSLIKAVAANKTAKAAKKNVGDNIWGQLLGDIGKALINTTEQADLRAWRLLPKNCYINEISLPYGTHTIEIVYYKNNTVLKRDLKTIDIQAENKLNMVMSYAF